MPDTPESFRSILKVVEYLKGLGYVVSKSTVYNHRNEGKLRPGPGGVYSVAAVQRYAKRWLERTDPETEDVDILDEKKIAEAQKAAAQAEHWRIKTKILKGQYVEKEAFERELAARALVFKADMENFFRSRAPEIIALVDGNPDCAPDLIDYLVKRSEQWLGRYAENKTFSVPGRPEVLS